MTAAQFKKEIMIAKDDDTILDVDEAPRELRDDCEFEDGHLFAVYKLDRILKLVDAPHLQVVTPKPKK